MSSNTGTGKASNEQVNRSHLFDVSHVTAVVTGGGTGIGLMITQALVANGAKVYITSRRDEVISQTAKLYSEEKGDGQQSKVIPIQADVSDKDDIKRLADEIASKEPNGIQLLVNNAGIARDDSTKYSNAGQPDFSSAKALSEHFLKSPPEAWADTLKTNVTALYYTSFAFLPLLAKGTNKTPGYSSSIVNITSVSGFNKGNSRGQFAYATSKAAATHLTRMLAHTFSETKVRVNAIAPGLFPSEMTTGESGEDNKSALDTNPGNPAGRPGNDFDMAATILFLAGPGGIFYNEQVLCPDGGNTLMNPSVK